MKRWGLLCIGIGVLLFSGIASAQDYPKVEAFAGYSYLHTSIAGTGFNSNGGSGSVSFNPNRWLGIVADFGGYHSGTSGLNGNIFSYTFGPKIALRGDKFTPFVQTLFGGARASSGSFSTNAFAMALGGGVDYNVSPHFGVRLVQAEYVETKFNFSGSSSQNSARLSFGVVVR